MKNYSDAIMRAYDCRLPGGCRSDKKDTDTKKDVDTDKTLQETVINGKQALLRAVADKEERKRQEKFDRFIARLDKEIAQYKDDPENKDIHDSLVWIRQKAHGPGESAERAMWLYNDGRLRSEGELTRFFAAEEQEQEKERIEQVKASKDYKSARNAAGWWPILVFVVLPFTLLFCAVNGDGCYSGKDFLLNLFLTLLCGGAFILLIGGIIAAVAMDVSISCVDKAYKVPDSANHAATAAFVATTTVGTARACKSAAKKLMSKE